MRRFLRVAAVAVACAAALAATGIFAAERYYTSQSGQGCASCHEMTVFVSAMHGSAHRNRACMECHTATLATNEASDAGTSFTLTSKMEPTIFNYPLTVKVRLPASWKNLSATQDGKPASVKVIDHDGAKFGLIKAIPNGGKVLLKPAV